ncbi:MAG: hypothetical protein H7293_02810 [Candidatus Saccharibacteria bacterium]|nr:hypothetical protein [Rhodoferax sp.]
MPTHPLVRSVVLIALAFTLVATALLAYLSLAGSRPAMQDRYVTERENRPDPFRLRGCLDLALGTDPCNPGSTSASLPPHAAHLLNSVYAYASAKRGHSPNTRVLGATPEVSSPIMQGRNVQLTLQASEQDLAQTTADCYTGNTRACQRCHWCNTSKASSMFEGARARSLGLLVLDAQTGAIEAAASAYTACFAQQQRGEHPGTGCPELPNQLVPHLDRLGNQSLEQTAKLGSLTKIGIALALQQTDLSAAEAAALPNILTHSLTLPLIDIVMCKARGFDTQCAQARLTAIANMAQALGWRGQQADVLSAGQIPGLSALRFTARFMHNADGSALTSVPLALNRQALQACSQRAWHQCAGLDLGRLVPELFGTGEALASPFGVSNALLHLAAAANAQSAVSQAHLVQSAQDDNAKPLTPQAFRRPAVTKAQADAVIQGLIPGATIGTARSACLAAATAWPGGLLPCAAKANSPSALRIAGKTGTSVFSTDQGKNISLPLPQWRARCSRFAQALESSGSNKSNRYILKNEVRKCNMQPTKLYAFMVSKPGSSRWERIVVVFSERNWNQHTQLIDSPNDRGSNVAAEAGLAFANALYHPKVQP